MIRLIGVVLVLAGASSFGIGKAIQFYRQSRQLREFCHALEILKCEMNYSLAPLPQLCRISAKRAGGTAEAYFNQYAQALDEGLPRTKAGQRAMENTKSLTLPDDAKMALLELCDSLGRYELEGENNLLQLTAHRLRTASERCESEKKPLAKSYAALSVCTGIALAILML